MELLSSVQGDRIYLDTNVFIYGIEGFDPFTEELRGLFEAIDEGVIRAVTSELTLAEVLVKPFEEDDKRQQQIYRDALQGRQFLRLMPVVRPLLVEAARLRGSTSLRLPDAIHLASARETECTTFLTNDTGFREASDLPAVILSEVVEK